MILYREFPPSEGGNGNRVANHDEIVELQKQVRLLQEGMAECMAALDALMSISVNNVNQEWIKWMGDRVEFFRQGRERFNEKLIEQLKEEKPEAHQMNKEEAI